MKYHPQCNQTKNDIKEIAEIFKEKINHNVIYSQLYNVINNIIFNKCNTSGFLKFGLNYYINHKIPLNYPQGLYYVIQNKDVINAWNKIQANEIKQKMKEEISNSTTEDNVQTFGYKPKKSKSITDLLGE